MSACPFRHLWPAAGSSPAPGASPPACPFSGKAQQHKDGVTEPAAPAAPPVQPPPPASGVGGACATRGAPAELAAGAPGAEPGPGKALEPGTPSADPSAGKCPFLAGMGGVALAGPTPDGQPATQTDAAPAVCPLGFGGAQGPKMGQFHCLLCKSLFFDCVVASCGHRYCAGCVSRARDCPACGADITVLAPDTATQALVERYIDAHAASHTIWELEAPAGGAQQVEGMAGERGRASFLLQLGLRAIAAGNTASARHRFEACQRELEAQLERLQRGGGTAEELAALQCRLGAVSGCLGDCCRAEGDAAGTLDRYQRSVELLRGAGDDPEARQALSVSLNKLGELQHVRGEVESAAELYGQALRLRRALLAATRTQWPGGEPGGGGEAAEARCSAALDLAASCVKLAGARRELGGAADGEAQRLLAEAAELLAGEEGGLAAQPARLRRKHGALGEYVRALKAASA